MHFHSKQNSLNFHIKRDNCPGCDEQTDCLFYDTFVGDCCGSCSPFGETETSWSDEQFSINGNITGLNVRAGAAVDAIRVKYGTSWGPWHGGGGGEFFSFGLNPGEIIIKVQGTSGRLPWPNYDIIISIEFITNHGRIFGPYGGSAPGEISWGSSSYSYYALIWIDGNDYSSFENGPIKSLGFNYDCNSIGNISDNFYIPKYLTFHFESIPMYLL